ncbi:BON domain-containing protein [Methylocella sp.]|uniref:BON domain-containing protein n=1 Tax=Methylocella sp. TaxID=1978226 RepID=UPI00378436B8
MASQDRRYQYEQYQQDDYFRDSSRERWQRDQENDDDRRLHGRSDRDYRESLSGYGQGREFYPREARGYGGGERGPHEGGFRRRDDYGAEDLAREDYDGRRGERRFGESLYGQRGDPWDRGRQAYSGEPNFRNREPYRGGYRAGGRSESWGWRDRGYESGPRGYDGQDERPFLDRASDEVSSWFGDEDAARRRRHDQARDQYARYSGVGPKNYRRSDERIREDVSDRLSDDPYVNAEDIEVAASNGEVTLTGAADDRDQRRRAEIVAERVSGVSHVQNNLRVRESNARSGPSGRETAHAGAQSGLTQQGGQLGAGQTGQTAGASQGQSTASRQG